MYTDSEYKEASLPFKNEEKNNNLTIRRNMHSIKGIYNGKWVIPLEKVHSRPNIKVIITFLEEEPGNIYNDNQQAKESTSRKAGTLKGKIHIKSNFDEPLDDFKEYME